MKLPLMVFVQGVVIAMTATTVSWAEEAVLGGQMAGLLRWAQENNPEFASMRHEAQAATERVLPAGALPDPKFRTELMDITKGGEQNPALLPDQVGSTRYTFMQDLPWFGKRDLKRDIAQRQADNSQAKTQGVWRELAAKIKTAQAQRFLLHGSEQLTQEILELMVQLEAISKARYAGGLAAQQDVIRAQIEQTAMRNELVALAGERTQADVRLNGLLARPSKAPLALPEGARAIPTAAQLDLATLQERARQHNPLVLAEQASIAAAQKTRELSYKNRYPDFTLSITPTQMQNAINEWSLMVELNLPLQQSARRSMERETESMLLAAQTRQQALANQVQADLAENLAALNAAQRMGELATGSLLPQAQLIFKSALTGYENNKVDFATLLDAQRQIRQARQNQIKAQFEAQMRLAEIEKLTGEDL